MIGTNQYPWLQFAQAAKIPWPRFLPEALESCRQAGIQAWEPAFTSTEEVDPLAAQLRDAGLRMPSAYCGARLHHDQADAEVERVTAIARKLAPHHCRQIIVNPDPIAWGGPEEKTDNQLDIQAGALSRLGRQLAQLGLRLLYHIHDAEMRQNGREFHAMMEAVDNRHMGLCLDAHWIYRGAGNRSQAVDDCLDRYLQRIENVHLRQSRNGVWTQTLAEGDLDWSAIATRITNAGLRPLPVLECAVEPRTDFPLSHQEAHRISRQFAETLFPDPAKT